MDTLCSCGCTEAHVFAIRETLDGRRVRLWTDGNVTLAIPGDPPVRGLGTPSSLRSRYAVNARARAIRLVADEIGLFDLDRIPDLVCVGANSFRHRWSNEDDQRCTVVLNTIRREG